MPEGSLSYHLNTLATEVDSEKKLVKTANGQSIEYDILVLATGSNAILPKVIPGHDATGVFVYRTISDLQKLIAFSATKKGTTGVVVGGGLLGLEAAKAMMDLEEFGKIKVIESIPYVLGRQVDSEGDKPSIFLNLNSNAAKVGPWLSSRLETWALTSSLGKW